jgi:hypothetical protein
MLLRCSQFRRAAFADPSLTSRHRDLVPVPDRVVPVGQVAAAVTHPADLRLADRRLADLRLADRPLVGAAAPHLTGQVDLHPAGLHPADLAGKRLADLLRLAPAGTGLMVQADLRLAGPAARVTPVDRARPVGRVIRAAPEHTSRADLEALVARAVPVAPVGRELTSLEDQADQADLADLVVPVDLAGPVVRVDRTGLVDRLRLEHRAGRHRRPTDPPAPTTGVVRSGAVPPTRLTASAHPTTVRRHHPHSAGSAGTTVLLPVARRLTGTARHLRAVGMAPRLRVVGTVTGMGRRATSLMRRQITDRSPTTASPRFRSSTQYSVDGGSGSSETGSRCTDLGSTLAASGSLRSPSGGGECLRIWRIARGP